MVLGGLLASSVCTITTNEPGGGRTVTTLTYTGWSCSAMSADTGTRANAQASELGGSTHYDCACDGVGV